MMHHDWFYFSEDFQTIFTQSGITNKIGTILWAENHWKKLEEFKINYSKDCVIRLRSQMPYLSSHLIGPKVIEFLETLQYLYFYNYTVFWIFDRICASSYYSLGGFFHHFAHMLNLDVLKRTPDCLKTECNLSTESVPSWVRERLEFWNRLLNNSAFKIIKNVSKRIQNKLFENKSNFIINPDYSDYLFFPEIGILYDLYDRETSKMIRQLLSEYYIQKAGKCVKFLREVKKRTQVWE